MLEQQCLQKCDDIPECKYAMTKPFFRQTPGTKAELFSDAKVMELKGMERTELTVLTKQSRYDVTFWANTCKNIPTNAQYISVEQNVTINRPRKVDYFKPIPGASFCDMMVSGSKHMHSFNPTVDPFRSVTPYYNTTTNTTPPAGSYLGGSVEYYLANQNEAPSIFSVLGPERDTVLFWGGSQWDGYNGIVAYFTAQEPNLPNGQWRCIEDKVVQVDCLGLNVKFRSDNGQHTECSDYVTDAHKNSGTQPITCNATSIADNAWPGGRALTQGNICSRAFWHQ
jgi:hypothetical protein